MASLVARSPRRWTKQEDQILQCEAELQLSQGSVKDWNRIAAKLPGRTNKDCRKRWSKTYGSVRKGAWDQAEDERLLDAIRKHGLRWVQVASDVETRNADQCSKRWQHSLDPALDHGKWSQQDDDRLLKAVEVYGRNWKTISTNVFPSRSGTDIKNRHVCLVRKQKKNDAQSAEPSTSSRATNETHQRSAPNRPAQVQEDEESEDESSEEEDEEDEAEQPQHDAFQHSRVNSAEDTNFEFGNFFGNSAMVSRGSISGDLMFSGPMSDIAFTPSLTSTSDPSSLGFEPSEAHPRNLMPLNTMRNSNDTFAGFPYPSTAMPGKLAPQNNASGWNDYSSLMDAEFETTISSSGPSNDGAIINQFDTTVSVGTQIVAPDATSSSMTATSSMTVSTAESSGLPVPESPTADRKTDPSGRNRLVLENVDGETLNDLMAVVTNSNRNVTMHFYRN